MESILVKFLAIFLFIVQAVCFIGSGVDFEKRAWKQVLVDEGYAEWKVSPRGRVYWRMRSERTLPLK